jgi:hypothetical protein
LSGIEKPSKREEAPARFSLFGSKRKSQESK